MFRSKFFHNVRSKRKFISFSENILESNYLVKGVRAAWVPVIKMSACSCVSGFKPFQMFRGKPTTHGPIRSDVASTEKRMCWLIEFCLTKCKFEMWIKDANFGINQGQVFLGMEKICLGWPSERTVKNYSQHLGSWFCITVYCTAGKSEMSFQPDLYCPWSGSVWLTNWSQHGSTACAALCQPIRVLSWMITRGRSAQPTADGWAVMDALPDQRIRFKLMRTL